MDQVKMRAELINDEDKKNTVYRDSLGIWTIGVGRNVDPDHGGGLTDEEVLYLLDNDIGRRWAEIRRRWPWVVNLSDARQRALINMSFMGMEKLAGFTHMFAALQAGDWETAADEALNSKWAYQVDDGPGGHIGRADRVAALILNG